MERNTKNKIVVTLFLIFPQQMRKEQLLAKFIQENNHKLPEAETRTWCLRHLAWCICFMRWSIWYLEWNSFSLHEYEYFGFLFSGYYIVQSRPLVIILCGKNTPAGKKSTPSPLVAFETNKSYEYIANISELLNSCFFLGI